LLIRHINAQHGIDYVFRDEKGEILAAGGGYALLLDNK
jgi:hypothetical protein